MVVIDELPWPAEQDASFDSVLQTAWDRLLPRRPVLLLLLGSDLHMMERLTAYDQPFFGRADKRVLAIDEPLSTRPGRPALYRIADSNLRLYLAILRSAQELSRRGRYQSAFRLIQRRWSTWRGRAIEPLIRESLELAALAGALPWPEVETVGGWWNRRFDPEIDLVGADRGPIARNVYFAGSVEWLDTPFDDHDMSALHKSISQMPDYEPGKTGLVIATRSGTARCNADLTWGPDDILSAWSS
ncbi:DUF234 domain-containing protein [Nocardia grenadensis]|uniref:DUF234 domain-containing protein n=1 Tax=Nocardia grenadensis TaxID=931537 RepID=UPI003D745A65